MRHKKNAGADSVSRSYHAEPAPASAAPAPYSAFPSPAQRLQQTLAHEYDSIPIRKWPPAATLGFVLATCGSFWAGVGVLAARIL